VGVVTCTACGTENESGRKFCGECGASLALVCPACATPNPPSVKFCGECGKSLAASAPNTGDAGPPVAERRLVTVLFADLVGFTTATEGRDAEDTRELLTRYFELSRQVIERYGGTIEKFIGDAVMAVWGAPVANEDDAERAVRAALELVDAVPTLDADLAARAGVLTGEAAVTLGAADQGMVAGDLVNTASRIQSAAEPGQVLAGETTRRASEAAIAFASAGEHELKGKTQPVSLWQAIRVAAQRRGEGRAVGLEAPFVGRASDLRLVKDFFHATADERRARVVSVVGVAGIGKSRLSWEFEKYVDGLADEIWWHRGRCLSYGEGVAFWALAEMIRGRAKIAENDDATTSAEKLGAMLGLHVPDPEERAWIEPRLLQLLGLSDRIAPDREDLFSAWRRFFERLAESGPLVMVVEDIHWADEGLVAFLEYLLDWGRHHPIFMLTLARPEVADRHPGFPGTARSAVTLPLEPLAPDAMDELLTGLVPGLPDELRDSLREAAEGIPLYAVETVRMLHDRGLLTGETIAGDLTSFEVPETLHALIASRLDAVPEKERSLLQDASVLGKTFTRAGLGALSGRPSDEIDGLVTSLIRKELLAIETDPFSPERGQLGFLQALVQRITYETIARRDRRRRHLAAAQFLATEAGIDPDEIAEVIAAHYLDAHGADPAAADGDDVRAEARRWFTRAAERAASLAASREAQRAFEQAAELAGEEVERGRSLARAGEHAVMGGRFDEATPLLEQAIDILGRAGARADAARAEVTLGELLLVSNRIEEGVTLLERALAAHESEGDEEAIASVSVELGRLLFFEERREEAFGHVERALEVGERLRLTDVVVQGLINKGLLYQGRPNESVGLMRQALLMAEESGDERGAIRAFMNLGFLLAIAGRSREAEEVFERGIALARRRGDRSWELGLTSNLVSVYFVAGRWDDLGRVIDELPHEGRISASPIHASMMLDVATVAMHRGETERARELASEYAAWDESAHVQVRGVRLWARVIVAQMDGRHEDAVADCIHGLHDPGQTRNAVAVEVFLVAGCQSARELGSAGTIAELIALAEAAPLVIGPPLQAQLAFQRARLAVLRQDDEPPFEAAVTALRVSDDPFWVAIALLEHAEWLADRGQTDEIAPLVAESRATFEQLRVPPMLERVATLERLAVPNLEAALDG
jgi:class 3 adenylate cyclase/tetratricopeptide (TPR) repeat protein